MGSFAYNARVTLAALAFSAPLVSACAAHHTEATSSDETALLAQDGSDANDVETQTTSLTAAFTLGLSSGAMTSAGMIDAASRASDYFAPAGCMTVSADTTAQKATFTLDACTGPWGLVRVSGTVTAVYSQVPGGVQIDVDGSALRYGHASAAYHATAVFTADNLSRTMTWTGNLTGVTARGRAFERSAAWTIRWKVGDACVSLEGSAHGTVLGRAIDTDVQSYVRCRGECPEPNGKIVITETQSQRSVVIDFDGSNEAKVVSSTSAPTSILLACGL